MIIPNHFLLGAFVLVCFSCSLTASWKKKNQQLFPKKDEEVTYFFKWIVISINMILPWYLSKNVKWNLHRDGVMNGAKLTGLVVY